MRTAVGLLTLVAALSVAACSGDQDAAGARPSASSSASDSPQPPRLEGPECSTIWKTGETLPEDFTACVVDGRQATIDVTECTDGSRLIVAEDLMWARTGDTIRRPDVAPLQDTEEYGRAWSDCTGE